MNIKKTRINAMYSQKDFAKLLDVSLASIQRWEQLGVEPGPTLKRKIIEVCKKNHIEIC